MPEPEQKASLYNVLRQQFAEQLQPQLQHKTTLIALSHAIEEEILSSSLSPVIFVGFQKLHYYQQEQPRYEKLRAQAQAVTLYGENISADHAYIHDWFVVVNEPRLKVVMVSHQLETDQAVGAGSMKESNRPFVGVWSYNPEIVNFACRYLAQRDSVVLAETVERAISLPHQPLIQIQYMSNISDRIFAQMEHATSRTLTQINHSHRLLVELQQQATQINHAKTVAENERDSLHQELKRLYFELTRSQTIMTEAVINRTRLEKVVETSKVLLQQLQAQLDRLPNRANDSKTIELLGKIQGTLEEPETLKP